MSLIQCEYLQIAVIFLMKLGQAEVEISILPSMLVLDGWVGTLGEIILYSYGIINSKCVLLTLSDQTCLENNSTSYIQLQNRAVDQTF